MFQFTGLPPYDYGFIIRYTESVCVGCPIRRSPDQRVFAPPRSFSQLVTSFIGSQCQGIRPAPFMLDRITVALPVIALTGSLMNCFFSVSPGNGDTADRNFRFRPESSHFCDSSDVFLILCLLRLDVFTSQAVTARISRRPVLLNASPALDTLAFRQHVFTHPAACM